MEKTLPGFPQYTININGEIRNSLRGNIMKTQLVRGYPAVHIGYKGNRKLITVHRLVALSFIPNPENKPQVNHINGDKTDFSIENLEWCTQSENIRHAYRTGLTLGRRKSPNKVLRLRESKYFGVYLDTHSKRTKPYKAMMKINNKTVSLGYYKTREEASEVVQKYLKASD